MAFQMPFVETSISRRVFLTIERSRQFGDCAAIVGLPGLGKTIAIQEYASAHPAVRLVTATPQNAGSMISMGRALADAVRVPVERGGYSLWSDLSTRFATYDGLTLIIDEAQNLKLNIIRQILTLNDEHRTPIVLCGNENVLRRVSSRTGDFEQISSRIGLRVRLNSIQADDADVIVNAFGVEGMEVYRAMRAIGDKLHARGIVRVMTMARAVAGEGKVIRYHHVCDALDTFQDIRNEVFGIERLPAD